jgi:hypothetical protein
MDKIPFWLAIVGSLAFGVIIAVIVQLFLVPRMKRKILEANKVENKI